MILIYLRFWNMDTLCTVDCFYFISSFLINPQIFPERPRGAHAAKFSFSKIHGDLKNECFFENL